MKFVVTITLSYIRYMKTTITNYTMKNSTTVFTSIRDSRIAWEIIQDKFRSLIDREKSSSCELEFKTVNDAEDFMTEMFDENLEAWM